MAESLRAASEPITLRKCLEAMTREEELGGEEKFYCSECKKHQVRSFRGANMAPNTKLDSSFKFQFQLISAGGAAETSNLAAAADPNRATEAIPLPQRQMD